MRTVNRTKYAEVRYISAEGCLVTTVGNDITLETPKASVHSIRKARKSRKAADLSWLMADVLSTPSAYRT